MARRELTPFELTKDGDIFEGLDCKAKDVASFSIEM